MVRDKDINSWREKYRENCRDKRVAGIMREKYSVLAFISYSLSMDMDKG